MSCAALQQTVGGARYLTEATLEALRAAASRPVAPHMGRSAGAGPQPCRTSLSMAAKARCAAVAAPHGRVG